MAVGIEVQRGDMAVPVISVGAIATIGVVAGAAAGTVTVERVVAVRAVGLVPSITCLRTVGVVVQFIVVALHIIGISQIAAVCVIVIPTARPIQIDHIYSMAAV